MREKQEHSVRPTEPMTKRKRPRLHVQTQLQISANTAPERIALQPHKRRESSDHTIRVEVAQALEQLGTNTSCWQGTRSWARARPEYFPKSLVLLEVAPKISRTLPTVLGGFWRLVVLQDPASQRLRASSAPWNVLAEHRPHIHLTLMVVSQWWKSPLMVLFLLPLCPTCWSLPGYLLRRRFARVSTPVAEEPVAEEPV